MSVLRVILVLTCGAVFCLGAEYTAAVGPYRSRGLEDPMNPKMELKGYKPLKAERPAEYCTVTEAMKDPMVSRIFVNGAKADQTEKPVPPPPPPSESFEERLEGYTSRISDALEKGDYLLAVLISDEALEDIKQYSRTSEEPEAKFLKIIRTFEDRKGEAEELRIRAEAQVLLSSGTIVLSGILWDEEEAVAVINGKTCSAGVAIGDIVISAVYKDRIVLNLKYKGRDFTKELVLE